MLFGGRHFEFTQAGEETGFIAELRGVVVVGVTAFFIRQDEHAWPQRADNGGDHQPILPGVLYAAIGNIERAAPRNAQDARSFGGFAGAIGSRTARSHLATREIEDSGAVS